MTVRLALAVLFVAASSLPLAAGPQSAYSDLDLKRCATIETFEEGGGARLRCRGYAGIDVVVTEGDLRMYVGYGRHARNQCAMHQTFGPFNSLGPKVEWRLDKGRPFATILRWLLDNGDGNSQTSWLVVTGLDGVNTCHVAYIEGAMPKANQRARDAADLYARGFDCAADKPIVIARPGADTSGFFTGPCKSE